MVGTGYDGAKAQQPDTGVLRVGLFGAGAALVAAAGRPERIAAVVSRGGRPDLAGPALPRVQVPTLLMVGGDDVPVIGMNQETLAQTRTKKRLGIVPRATHLFEEPGTREQVARLAIRWFTRHPTGDDATAVPKWFSADAGQPGAHPPG